MEAEIEAFFSELYAVEMKKVVLQGCAGGESVRDIAVKFHITDERIRQIEAKITRKFVMSQSGRSILSKLSTLRTTDEWKAYAGKHYAEMLHLMRLYKTSFYYDGTSLESLPFEESIVHEEHRKNA